MRAELISVWTMLRPYCDVGVLLNFVPAFRRWAEARWRRTRLQAWMTQHVYAGRPIHRAVLKKGKLHVR